MIYELQGRLTPSSMISPAVAAQSAARAQGFGIGGLRKINVFDSQ
jgi:hypothetical protein